MPLEISEASADDAAEISALAIKTYVDKFGAEFEPDELARHLDRSIAVQRWIDYFRTDRVLWCKLDGRPIGYVHFGPGTDMEEKVIHRLYVEAAHQGRGIGSALLERALAELAGAPVVTIDVWQDNPDARRLYERFGFRHEGGLQPFVSTDGRIEGYDLILVRRQAV
jgi:GNAT superfamily N-acetyltransferase